MTGIVIKGSAHLLQIFILYGCLVDAQVIFALFLNEEIVEDLFQFIYFIFASSIKATVAVQGDFRCFLCVVVNVGLGCLKSRSSAQLVVATVNGVGSSDGYVLLCTFFLLLQQVLKLNEVSRTLEHRVCFNPIVHSFLIGFCLRLLIFASIFRQLLNRTCYL